jgi:hypothetical protein
MKSRSEIWFALATEVGNACSVSTVRDVKTVADRVAAEGDAFFAITLPAFEKDFLTSLSLGYIPSDAFRSFARRKTVVEGRKVRGVPEFLGGFLDQLFMSETWGLAADDSGRYESRTFPNPVLRPFDITDKETFRRMAMAVKAVRQLTLLFSKEKALCSTEKVAKAIENYRQVDGELIFPLATSEETAFLKEVFSRMLEGYSVSRLGIFFPE